MKILLTTLHSKYVHASLALPYLKAYCQDICPDMVIREYSVNEPKEVVLAEIMSLHPQVICFSVYLWNRRATLDLAACIRRIDPAIKIVLGGPEVSFEEDLFFDRFEVDAIIRGEGEIPLRHLLAAWQKDQLPTALAGLQLPTVQNPVDTSLLTSLDAIPSPFQAGLVDLSKGLVYFESSRGCPYSCSFCMSSLDKRVRSFSMERIQADLLLLLQNRVSLIKFVDRTFNYDPARAYELFSFILANNIASQFHFEIGAHLLDEQTLRLLEKVPQGVFQFEIGVQSTLPETLQLVRRQASLEKLEQNIRRLKQRTAVHVHLDLIAGLPGESYQQFLRSVDRTCALGPDHLQLEPVKLLPGAPLRAQVNNWGIRFDPQPPYTILAADSISFDELERIRGIGRLLDLVVNSGRFHHSLNGLQALGLTISTVLEGLDRFWRDNDLYRQGRSLRALYFEVDGYLQKNFSGLELLRLRECLGRDFAGHERVVSGSAPDFFDVKLSAAEVAAVKQCLKAELAHLERQGKIQYFAAAFQHLPDYPAGRTLLLFLYHSKTASGLEVKELAVR